MQRNESFNIRYEKVSKREWRQNILRWKKSKESAFDFTFLKGKARDVYFCVRTPFFHSCCVCFAQLSSIAALLNK